MVVFKDDTIKKFYSNIKHKFDVSIWLINSKSLDIRGDKKTLEDIKKLSSLFLLDSSDIEKRSSDKLYLSIF